MTSWSVLTVDPSTGELRPRPLPLDGPGSRCQILLQALPGASGLHLEARKAGEVAARFELPAAGSDPVSVDLAVNGDGQLVASSPHRVLFTWPPDGRALPPCPVLLPADSAPRDVLFVIDATTRGQEEASPGEPSHRRALLATHAWNAVMERLVELGMLLAADRDTRFDVLAFADDPHLPIDAPELKPRFQLWPTAPLGSRPFSPAALGERLRAVPPSPGADFVDALSEALVRARRFPWRPGSRRFLVLFGDSPGFSLLDPAPVEADLGVRHHTVESAARNLHREGVVRITLHQDFDASHGPAAPALAELLAHARSQYEALASIPDLAFTAATFDPRQAGQVLARLPVVLGCGATAGVWVEDEATDA